MIFYLFKRFISHLKVCLLVSIAISLIFILSKVNGLFQEVSCQFKFEYLINAFFRSFIELSSFRKEAYMVRILDIFRYFIFYWSRYWPSYLYTLFGMHVNHFELGKIYFFFVKFFEKGSSHCVSNFGRL